MPTEDDAKLIALGRQISALRVLELVADAECKRCHEICKILSEATREGGSGGPTSSSQEEAMDRYTAAEHASNVIIDQMSKTYDQMIRLRPTMLEGLRALALAIVEHCWSDEIHVGDTSDWKGMAVIISSLTGVPITADEEQAA
jgi:hypothetical protein